jgi:SAM-dependent methyltransferase
MRVLANIRIMMLACALLGAGHSHAQGDEVPFITTPDNITIAMLEISKVGKRDFVIDLGSGDGRIVITAAKQFGARGLGVELVADLVRQSREHAAKAGVADRAQFVEMDLFKADLAPATVVTMYLLPEVNLLLRPRLLCLKPGTRIVSHDWDMGDWKPEKMMMLPAPDKTIGLKKESTVYLWRVPPRKTGEQCSRIPAAPMKKPG